MTPHSGPNVDPTSGSKASDLSTRLLAGDARAIARAITLIENDDPLAPGIIAAIFGRTGRAFVIGVTGPPGAGKSTLVDRLTAEFRARDRGVGIIAVDPTSPFTGGAVLGDRVRMLQHALDEQVFVRSMATRGHLGGLARATGDAVLVLDAAGKDVVIIETVGVGQDEIDIVRTADVSLVTLVPGTGDEVQALKAGIMEIADIFVVNKADREGADRLVSAIEANLALHAYAADEWRPPILKTTATTGAGITALMAAIESFRAQAVGRKDRRVARSEDQLRDLIARQLLAHLEGRVLAPRELQQTAERIAAREVDPHTAARELVRRLLPGV
jgi:LAO/AO transport system kinase